MKTIIFNQQKINELQKKFLEINENVNRELNRIEDLIAILPEYFLDSKNKDLCDKIQNDTLIELKAYCERITNMNKFLSKIGIVYTFYENKEIINEVEYGTNKN